MKRAAGTVTWRLALALAILIVPRACLAQAMKTQDISFGSLARISVPPSWVRSDDRAVLPAARLKFAPDASSRYGIFVFDAGLPISSAAARTIQGVFDPNVNAPAALTPEQIEGLSSELGNVGDNQYSNRTKWPADGAPLFQVTRAQTVSVKGKIAIIVDGNFLDPATNQPKLFFVGLFTPSDVGGRRMISVYAQSPSNDEFAMLSGAFDDVINSIEWQGVPGRSANPQPNPQASLPASANNYANELTDWDVPAQATLKYDVGSKTPLTIPGARRITTPELQRLGAQMGAQPVLVDVLDSKHARTIPGAIYVPGAGNYGRFDDQVQSRLFRLLSGLSNGDMDRPIVFFCEGAVCWESYNAALRAINMGFRNVLWYRGGLASWTEANLSLGAIPAPRRVK